MSNVNIVIKTQYGNVFMKTLNLSSFSTHVNNGALMKTLEGSFPFLKEGKERIFELYINYSSLAKVGCPMLRVPIFARKPDDINQLLLETLEKMKGKKNPLKTK